MSFIANEIDFGKWEEVYNKYVNNKSAYEYVQLTGSDGKPKNVIAAVSRMLDLTYADRTVFYYEATGNMKNPYMLAIAKAAADRYGIMATGQGLVSTDGVVSLDLAEGFEFGVDNKVALKLASNMKINDSGELEAAVEDSLALIPVRENFASTTGVVVTLPTPVTQVDEYMVTPPVPLENTLGTLGEVWIVKEVDKFTIYNSGSFVGKFEASYALVK